MMIKVKIDRTGKSTIEVHGVKGRACEDVTRFLEQALGRIERREQTAEYFEQAVVEEREHETQGQE